MTDINAQTLATALMDSAGLTPQEIAEALDNRVSSRTIYRWAKGESDPGNASDFIALFDLAKTCRVLRADQRMPDPIPVGRKEKEKPDEAKPEEVKAEEKKVEEPSEVKVDV